MVNTAKKVSEYFKFMRDILQKQYKGLKHPKQLKDDERKNFFNQVRKEWEEHKSSKRSSIIAKVATKLKTK